MAAPLQSGQRVSAVSDHAEGWKDDEYVGYSICCKTSADKSRVLQAIGDNNSNPRARTMRVTEFTNFIFVEPAKPMNLSAFDSWRYRLEIRELDLILHKVADTALEGLPSSMRRTNPSRGSRACMHFLPPKVGGVSAAATLLEELVGGAGSQPPVRVMHMGGASADVSHPGVSSDAITPHRSRPSPPIDRTHRVDALTPILFGEDQELLQRGIGYAIGKKVGGGSFGVVHKAKSPTGIDVAVKILHKDAWKDDKAKQRTMKEVYTLERCSDHDVHIVRVLDVFLDDHRRQMHIVMELWGESGKQFRCRKGFGRLEPQSTTHVRTLLLHLCSGLSYLHRGLGMCHTDVKLDNILVIDKHGSTVDDIECKLADVGSVEEVSALIT
jgi:tRNA A-37 threonylcarbamoyl transferase component Bud32